MAWRSRSTPYFRPGQALNQRRPTEAFGRCPVALVNKLSANGLLPDEATDRHGNCGIDAFARSLMDQMGKGRAGVGQTGAARNQRHLQKSPDKVALLRRIGVSWLEADASEVIWPGLTVAKLCSAVSGLSFQEYVAKVQQDGEWVDTAFLHALGRAHGVNVLIFQAHTDEALVGEDMMEDPGNESDRPIMVPIAVVNDHHFWGVVECEAEVAISPVDKGEFAAFRSQAGKGLCPDSSGRPARDEDSGLEDGEAPDWTFATAPPEAAHTEAELALCVALANWEPWSTPSACILEAMGLLERVRGNAPATLDMSTRCVRRAEAIVELAYEDAHFKDMPESYRYRRLAQMRLCGCPQWARHRRGRNRTSQYLSTCTGIQSVAVLDRLLDEGNCAKHNKDHGAENPHCRGMAGLSANMVYNWRVLWWSLPKVQRKEHVLHLFVNSLRAHRASGAPDERWRTQYTFLGRSVCREAFTSLTGIGISTLQAARGQALAGKASWSSVAERCMHGGTLGNNSKAAAYLGVRQWLEWYAETHAESSPMDGKSYLPAGRKLFYYAHYRKHILERHGVTEADAADASASALASRRSKRRRRSIVEATTGGASTDAGAYVPASDAWGLCPSIAKHGRCSTGGARRLFASMAD